jgi:hypothetical protein
MASFARCSSMLLGCTWDEEGRGKEGRKWTVQHGIVGGHGGGERAKVASWLLYAYINGLEIVWRQTQPTCGEIRGGHIVADYSRTTIIICAARTGRSISTSDSVDSHHHHHHVAHVYFTNLWQFVRCNEKWQGWRDATSYGRFAPQLQDAVGFLWIAEGFEIDRESDDSGI